MDFNQLTSFDDGCKFEFNWLLSFAKIPPQQIIICRFDFNRRLILLQRIFQF